MWRLARNSIGVFLVSATLLCSEETKVASDPSAVPANQLSVSGNACGPTALLNAFRFGNKDWQRALDGVSGNNDRERILRIIREIGMRPSKHLPGRARWSRGGVSLADLKDMANEMVLGKYLPPLNDEVFFPKPGESPEKLLRRTHSRLETSLRKGLPPILSIRRYVLRGKTPQWTLLDAHFVTVTAVPRRLERQARSFELSYIDPWGGRRSQGRIAIPDAPLLAAADGKGGCLEALFPGSKVGNTKVKPGEKSAIIVSAAIGRW